MFSFYVGNGVESTLLDYYKELTMTIAYLFITSKNLNAI